MATEVDGSRAPEPGDLSVCFPCGAFLKFADDLSLLCLANDEFDALPFEARRALLGAAMAAKMARQAVGRKSPLVPPEGSH